MSISEPSQLLNPLINSAQLDASASQLDGVPKDLEDSVRFETARLIQAAGILLRLPQEIIAQAIVTLQRYWSGPDGGSLLESDSKVCLPYGSCQNLDATNFLSWASKDTD